MNYYDERKKIRDDYYTIGDIARIYHVSADALRYYEDKGLIKPKRSESGYRLYTDQDIWRLNVIEDLRNLQFPVERIRSYLNEGTIDATLQILNEELDAVNQQLNKLNRIKSKIERRLTDIEEAKRLTLDEISIKHFEKRTAHCIYTKFSADEDMDKLMKTLAEDNNEKLDIIGNSRMAAILAPFDQEDYLYSGALMFQEEGDYVIPEGDYLSICYSGIWNSRWYAEKLKKYAKEHNLVLDNLFIDIVWIDIHTAIRLSDHISEVQVRIRH